jgi:uncharacterized protein YqhQ
VNDSMVLEVLAAADEAVSLPQLGGMARPNGVAIVSERVWCFSPADGGAVSLRVMPQTTSRLARLPLLRGLVKLSAALVPVFGRGAAARPGERLLLVAAIVAPLPLLAVPASLRNVALLVVTCAMIAWMFRGRTLKLHGAEHRAIAAAEARLLIATWRGEVRPSRFAPRCGTNFAALMLVVSLLLARVWVLPTAAVTPVLVPLVSLMVTMEIWLAAQRSASRLARVLLWPGLLLQRLTTREPTLAETRIALRAVAAVLATDR